MNTSKLLAAVVAIAGTGNAAAQSLIPALAPAIAPTGGARAVAQSTSRVTTAVTQFPVYTVPGALLSVGIARRYELSNSDNTELFSQQRDSIAVLPDGGFAAAWMEGEFPLPVHVRLQYHDADGRRRLPAGGMVVGTHAFEYALIEVVPHPLSGVFVVYARYETLQQGEVRVSWIDASGQPRWGTTGVSAFGPQVFPIVFGAPTVMADTVGGAYVCATREDLGSDDDALMCQHLDANGELLWPATGIAAGGEPGWRVLPSLLPDGSGGALVVWSNHRRIFTAPGLLRVEGQRFASDGERLWGASGKLLRETAIPGFDSHAYLELQAVPDGANGLIFIVEDWNGVAPASRDVVAQRVSVDGDPVWPSGVYLGATAEIEQVDSLTAMPDGGAVVGVSRTDGVVTFKSSLHRVSATGAILWGDRPISAAPTSTQDYATFGQLIDGRLRFAYTAFGPSSYDMKLAEFSLFGNRLTPDDGLLLAGGVLNEFARGIAQDAAGRMTALVFDEWIPGQVAQSNTWIALHGSEVFADGFESAPAAR